MLCRLPTVTTVSSHLLSRPCFDPHHSSQGFEHCYRIVCMGEKVGGRGEGEGEGKERAKPACATEEGKLASGCMGGWRDMDQGTAGRSSPHLSAEQWCPQLLAAVSQSPAGAAGSLPECSQTVPACIRKIDEGFHCLLASLTLTTLSAAAVCAISEIASERCGSPRGDLALETWPLQSGKAGIMVG